MKLIWQNSNKRINHSRPPQHWKQLDWSRGERFRHFRVFIGCLSTCAGKEMSRTGPARPPHLTRKNRGGRGPVDFVFISTFLLNWDVGCCLLVGMVACWNDATVFETKIILKIKKNSKKFEKFSLIHLKYFPFF